MTPQSTAYASVSNCSFLLLSVTRCLKLYEVNIPRHVRRGEDTYLACLYDLRGQELYATKWYKDGKEFFRYEPSNPLQKKSFPERGIGVDVSLYYDVCETSLIEEVHVARW